MYNNITHLINRNLRRILCDDKSDISISASSQSSAIHSSRGCVDVLFLFTNGNHTLNHFGNHKIAKNLFSVTTTKASLANLYAGLVTILIGHAYIFGCTRIVGVSGLCLTGPESSTD